MDGLATSALTMKEEIIFETLVFNVTLALVLGSFLFL
jgi:hypothetical protein